MNDQSVLSANPGELPVRIGKNAENELDEGNANEAGCTTRGKPRTVRPKSFGTFSVSVGTSACNAHCPFCVADMTPSTHGGKAAQRLSFDDFNNVIGCLRKSAQFARNARIQTALITGKGEPTLHPGEIELVLRELQPYGFSITELQTNGLYLGQDPDTFNFHLGKWRALGLQTIAISVAHYDREANARIYTPKGDYMNLPNLIGRLRNFGFSVRLSVVMATGYIDSVPEVVKMIDFGRSHDIQQLTFRPVERPTVVRKMEVGSWVNEHYLPDSTLGKIETFLLEQSTLLDVLPHGALVMDYEGCNVCLTNCLTHDPEGTEIRQVINFLRGAKCCYSWEHPGAILF